MNKIDYAARIAVYKKAIACNGVLLQLIVALEELSEAQKEMLKRIKTKNLHFAWDRYEDKEIVHPKFQTFKEITQIDYRKLGVFVLCNFDTTFEQDLYRIYTLRDLGFSPFVMLYNKESIPKGHKLRKLQRWCNNRFIFAKCKTFEEYGKG